MAAESWGFARKKEKEFLTQIALIAQITVIIRKKNLDSRVHENDTKNELDIYVDFWAGGAVLDQVHDEVGESL